MARTRELDERRTGGDDGRKVVPVLAVLLRPTTKGGATRTLYHDGGDSVALVACLARDEPGLDRVWGEQ